MKRWFLTVREYPMENNKNYIVLKYNLISAQKEIVLLSHYRK